MQPDFTHTFENQILPLLCRSRWASRKNSPCALCNPGSPEAVSISLWEHKSNADDYDTRAHPEVLKTLAKTIDGTPRVQAFETVISPFHNVPATV
jgi:hypothetical protein